MTSDGIHSSDWDKVHAVALDLANADGDQHELIRLRLFERLDELISKYGELPSLLATKADYVEDSVESEQLFLRAFELARNRNDLKNIKEIALSLAELYATRLQSITQASSWLEIASAHMSPDDETGRVEHADISEMIEQLKNS